MVTSEAESSAPEQEEPATISSFVTTKSEELDSSNNIDNKEESAYTSSEVENNTTNLEVPGKQNGFKTWMPHTTLSTTSPNRKLLSKVGYTDKNGLWKIDDMYCVALGSYYSDQLGDIFEIELSSGNKFKAISVDHKADIHTDSTNRVTKGSGCVVEFIVNKNKLNDKIKVSGNVGILPEFAGTYTKIVKIGNYYK